jgi:hypothetical protein
MDVYEIDPTKDERWTNLLERHKHSSIFHTRGWLEALRKTYGYSSTAFTVSPPGRPLTNAIAFCRVSDWFMGRRLVSLPFSDHCSPLVEGHGQLVHLLSHLRAKQSRDGWNYVQVRSNDAALADSESSTRVYPFVLHKLDLKPGLSDVVRGFHDSCVRRKIKRAEREGLTYEVGTSDRLLGTFYRLLTIARRRHGAPPQPLHWFRAVLACLGDEARIWVAHQDARPVASIFTLQYKQRLVYKYGGSDHEADRLGGMQFLLWQAIQNASREGLQEFDMGRSEMDNDGLIKFKDRWGAQRTPLAYWQYPWQPQHDKASTAINIGKYVCSRVPASLLTAAGKLLYRYMG